MTSMEALSIYQAQGRSEASTESLPVALPVPKEGASGILAHAESLLASVSSMKRSVLELECEIETSSKRQKRDSDKITIDAPNAGHGKSIASRLARRRKSTPKVAANALRSSKTKRTVGNAKPSSSSTKSGKSSKKQSGAEKPQQNTPPSKRDFFVALKNKFMEMDARIRQLEGKASTRTGHDMIKSGLALVQKAKETIESGSDLIVVGQRMIQDRNET